MGKRFGCGSVEKIIFERATTTSDVLWDNIGISNCRRFVRRILTVIIGLVIILVNLAALTYLSIVKNNERSVIHSQLEAGVTVKPQAYYKIQNWSLLVAACIIISNEGGKHALSYFVDEENFATKTRIFVEKIKVITFFKFVNTAITPMAASFFTVSNYKSQFEAGGLIDDMSAVLIYYALIH